MSEPEVIPLRGNADVDPKARPSFMQRWRWPLIIGGPLLIAAVVVYFILTGGRTQTTDDAYVQISKAPVAPSIAGRVTDIYVHENQEVKRGQVLFRLDTRDIQATAEAASAQVANAALQVGALRASYLQQQAMVQAAKDQLAYAITDAARTKNLANVGVNSQAQVDQANHAVLAARQQLAAAQQQAAQVLANLGGNPTLAPAAAPAVMQAQAGVDASQAAWDKARLNLEWTRVVSPITGIAGATNPEEADPKSARGKFGRVTTKGIFENLVHVSSDDKEARREIALWFKKNELLIINGVAFRVFRIKLKQK